MAVIFIWATPIALYILFRLWYDNWRGALTPDEIEHYMAGFDAVPNSSKYTDREAFKNFLEKDDGKAVVMINLIKLHRSDQPNPETGELTPPLQLLGEYLDTFKKAMLVRAGHPVAMFRKAGPYVDAWHSDGTSGADGDPGWSAAGMMRYRSRRDMAELFIDPRFTAKHQFKIAGLEMTWSFPSQQIASLYLGPRLALALILALTAAITHLLILL